MPIKEKKRKKRISNDQLKSKYFKLEKEMYFKGLLPTEELNFPSFMCIGAQKAGTTWLFANLKKHPEIALKKKEIHYFDEDKHFYSPLYTYCKNFDFAKNRIKGDITPGYSTLEDDRIKLIKALMPKLRLILLLRNPIDRAISAAKMHFFKNNDTNSSSLDSETIIKFLSRPGVINKGKYTNTIKNFLKYFNDNQLLIDFYDNISSQPEELLKRIFKHINVKEDVDLNKFPVRKVVHKGKKEDFVIPKEVTEYLRSIFREEIIILKDKYGEVINHW